MNFLIYSVSLILLIFFSCAKKKNITDSTTGKSSINSQTANTNLSDQTKQTSAKTENAVQASKKSIPVTRVNHIDDDFSFAKEWRYSDYIFQTESGELHCDGMCDPSIDTMYDTNGNIKRHLRDTYYSLVDTTHFYQTIECDAWCYEYGGTDAIVAERYINGTVACYTMCNVSTHCSLIFELEPYSNLCSPVIELISIAGDKKFVYKSMDGFITIDTTAWSKDTLKALFDFKFVNTDGPEPMFWKGKIYAPIEKSARSNGQPDYLKGNRVD